MGNRQAHPSRFREFLDGPMKNNKYCYQRWTDEDLDELLVNLDRDIAIVQHLVHQLGLDVNLKGNHFSQEAKVRILDVVYERGFKIDKVRVLF